MGKKRTALTPANITGGSTVSRLCVTTTSYILHSVHSVYLPPNDMYSHAYCVWKLLVNGEVLFLFPTQSTAPARPRLPLLANSKVPTKLRQRFLDSFIDEILKVTLDPHLAYKKAEEEEGHLFQHCSSRMTYSSRATHALQRLR